MGSRRMRERGEKEKERENRKVCFKPRRGRSPRQPLLVTDRTKRSWFRRKLENNVFPKEISFFHKHNRDISSRSLLSRLSLGIHPVPVSLSSVCLSAQTPGAPCDVSTWTVGSAAPVTLSLCVVQGWGGRLLELWSGSLLVLLPLERELHYLLEFSIIFRPLFHLSPQKFSQGLLLLSYKYTSIRIKLEMHPVIIHSHASMAACLFTFYPKQAVLARLH